MNSSDRYERYWTLCCIKPSSKGEGYKYSPISIAQNFFQDFLTRLPDCVTLNEKKIQTALHSQFFLFDSPSQGRVSAKAGLCLRCYVSHSILKTCRKLDGLFGVDKRFTCRDLLPFVLNDDGVKLILLDGERKTQLILDKDKKTQDSTYPFFSVEILRTYQPSESSMSLDNWAELKTKQNQDLKRFLSEFGWKHLSDWALLNKARPRQLKCLSERDRHLVEVFHAVYRRDRYQERQTGRCPNPNDAQLQEMLALLQERTKVINTSPQLMRELRQIAKQLRQYNIWGSLVPLESYNPDTANYEPRSDLPQTSLDLLDVEEQEFVAFLHQQLRLTLVDAIEQEIQNHLQKLANSRKYAELVQHFMPGLQLYYTEGLSLQEIASRFGMTSHDQARRILNPGGLLNKVRTLTVQQLLDKMLEKAQSMGLTEIPPSPNYLKTLAEQVEAFADTEVFQEATAEIRAGRNRSLNSLYAQQLLLYCEQYVDINEE